MIETLTLRLTGTTALMVSNPVTVDPFADVSKAISELSSKKKRTEAENLELHRMKFVAALYVDDVGPFLPGFNILRSVQEGAKLLRQGKTVERGLTVRDSRLYLNYQGPKTADGLWKDKRFVDVRDGKVASGSRIPVTRPIFPPGWTLDVTFDVAPDVANPADILAHAVTAGRLIGVGTYRSRFGKFSVSLVKSSTDLRKIADNLGVEVLPNGKA